MKGKAAKTLMGLGGAGGAATTAGLMFGRETAEGRRVRIKAEITGNYGASDAKVKAFEEGKKNDLGTAKYTIRSDTEKEYLELTWITKVLKHAIGEGDENSLQYSKDEMASKEKEYWEKITKDENGILKKLSREEMEKVEEAFNDSPYWEKYKEVCVAWNLKTTEDDFNGENCVATEKWEDYKTKVVYLKYSEEKTEDEDLSFSEYYWTIWKKFQKDKKNDLAGKTSEEDISNVYEQWNKSRPSR